MTDNCKERNKSSSSNDLFVLNNKSQVQQVEGRRYVKLGCNSGGSEGCEVFLEEMTVQIRERDTAQLS